VGGVLGHHEPGTGDINFTKIYRKLAELGSLGRNADRTHDVGESERSFDVVSALSL
jgi:hydroxypyruvate isomerase